LLAGLARLALLSFGIVAGIFLVGLPSTVDELLTVVPTVSVLPWIGPAVFGLGVVFAYSSRLAGFPWIVAVLYVAYAGQVLGGALFGPLLSGLVGIVGLVTAAQWAWNAATAASPLTWIVLAIIAVIVVVVLLVKHWDWVKKVGTAAWDGIKLGASRAWDFLKKIPGWTVTAFKNIAKVLSWPYRTAFNLIADAWNNTIGRLSWTVPGWIPGIGGNTISVPHLPKFHSGGVVPGAAGSEMLAVLQAGETVIPAGGGSVIEIRSGGSQLDDLLVEILSRAVRRRGGNVQLALGGRNA
jgi:hypothetical protein